MRLLIGVVLFAAVALGQPTRPEAFGLVGYGRVSGDEGSLGSGVVAGGAVTVPFARRWAVDLDVAHQRSERVAGPFTFNARQTHVSPGLQYRRGRDDFYGFVAAGLGYSHSTIDGGGGQFHVKTGFVKVITGRLLLRAELFTLFRFVMPNVGVRAGIGYRF